MQVCYSTATKLPFLAAISYDETLATQTATDEDTGQVLPVTWLPSMRHPGQFVGLFLGGGKTVTPKDGTVVVSFKPKE